MNNSFTIKKGVLYPISLPDKSVLSPEKIIVTPPYDDEGINFKGYSKRLISLNEYKIFSQRTAWERAGHSTINGTNYSQYAKSLPNQPFYCNKIIIYSLNGHISGDTLFQIGNTGGTTSCNPTFGFQFDEITFRLNTNFLTPLKFDNPLIYFAFTSNGFNDFYIEFFGWYDLIN